MASGKFILRTDKKNSRGEAPIYYQYNHNDDKVLIATHQKTYPKDWNQSQGKPKTSVLEKYLEDFKNEFRKATLDALKGEDNPTAKKVKALWKEHLDSKMLDNPEAIFGKSMISQWEEYLQFMEETATPNGKRRTSGTIYNNTNSKNQLKSFLKEKKQDTKSPEKFTLKDYQKFEAHLLDIMNPNSVSKVKKHLKSFLKYHIKHGHKVGLNISHIEYAETAGLKIALAEDQLSTIANTTFLPSLNPFRDLMVLQASTGVRISDLHRLCENIVEDKSSFKIKTKKTGKHVLIPILPLARQVLERNNYLLPSFVEQNYRKGIKAIYKKLWPEKMMEVGEGDSLSRVLIHEEISSHDMVRTFINIALKKGISIPTIALITGKSIQVLLKNYQIENQEHAAQELLLKFEPSPLRIAQ